ncbi:MAG: UPF0175 family protein [Desulfotomaculales bacterium]
MTVEVPDELLPLVGEELRKHLAVALYAQGKISLGAAAELAGTHYVDFWKCVAQFGLGPRYTAEMLEEDVKNFRELGLL